MMCRRKERFAWNCNFWPSFSWELDWTRTFSTTSQAPPKSGGWGAGDRIWSVYTWELVTTRASLGRQESEARRGELVFWTIKPLWEGHPNSAGDLSPLTWCYSTQMKAIGSQNEAQSCAYWLKWRQKLTSPPQKGQKNRGAYEWGIDRSLVFVKVTTSHAHVIGWEIGKWILQTLLSYCWNNWFSFYSE